MIFKKSPQLPGTGRTTAGHHHGSHTPTCKMACQPKDIGRQCMGCNGPKVKKKLEPMNNLRFH